MKEKTAFLSKAINDLGDVLDSIPIEKGDIEEPIAGRIEKIISDKGEKGKRCFV
ncbi:hypothetical protein [Tangfeifania diversioriginum]|uniref:hypothetical protein n=1 Tax=Tangfeifania diversioriginum TaxID=1168035 RepID=UPI0015871DEE|nr:hypothetical protein [Tangfeifania diversioriginum]